jgi:predicted nucleic acid-binding protein
MILLDTNIISALMLAVPNPHVIQWLNQQQQSQLFLPSIVVAEIQYGLQRMPQGQRKSALVSQFSALLSTLFAGRIVPFAHNEAEAYGILRAAREAQGKPISVCDAPLAAKFTFRLDKFSGRVWQLVHTQENNSAWEEMKFVGLIKSPVTGHPHFQIFTSGIAARFTILIDTDTGSTWLSVTDVDQSHNETILWQPFS